MNWLQNISTAKKLILAFGSIFLIVVAANATIYFKNEEIKQTIHWTDHTNEVVATLNAVVSALARLFATTSMRVERVFSPVAAEWSAVIAMGSLSDGRGHSIESLKD